MNADKLFEEIQLQRYIFIQKIGIEPNSITMSIEDFITIERKMMESYIYHIRERKEHYIYGIKILRTNDLKSGEFKLSINLDKT